MKYFSIIINNQIIGACNSLSLKAYNPVNRLLLPAKGSDIQFIEYKDSLYHDYWMADAPVEKKFKYQLATVREISEEEFNAISSSLENNDVIPAVEEEPIKLEAVLLQTNEPTNIDYIKNLKLQEMSHTCNQVIEAGFDIELGGKVEHFSLTTQDQLNLISLSSMAANGMEAIPYHADGEICRFYSNAEMQAIVAQATAFKIYHTTYYNALKNYINSLDTVEEIAAVTYGMPLPEEYQSDVLKSLR